MQKTGKNMSANSYLQEKSREESRRLPDGAARGEAGRLGLYIKVFARTATYTDAISFTAVDASKYSAATATATAISTVAKPYIYIRLSCQVLSTMS